MDRFQQQTASDLQAGYSVHLRKIWGDDKEPQVETEKCDGCGHSMALDELQAVEDGTDTPLFLCEICKDMEAEEPECSCARVDVDLCDPLGCELHDSGSAWNVWRRLIQQRTEARAEQVMYRKAGLSELEAAAFERLIERVA